MERIEQFWPCTTLADEIRRVRGWWVDYWAFRGWWVVKPDPGLAVGRDGQVDDVMCAGPCNWTPNWYFPTREGAELALAKHMLCQEAQDTP